MAWRITRLYLVWVPYTNHSQRNEAVIMVTTGFDDFDNRICDLAERENECDSLFKEIKNGRGEKSLRYIAMRDSCKELRKENLRTAMPTSLALPTSFCLPGLTI